MTQRATEQAARPLYMGGRWHSTTQTLASHNPATGELLGTVCIADEPIVREATAVAHAALASWKALGERGRQAALWRLHAALAADSRALVRLITQEQGKPAGEALLADVNAGLDAIRYYAQRGTRDLKAGRLKTTLPMMIGQHVELVYEPAGVVAIVAPWNIPFGIPMAQVAAALIIGNTVVLKPSEWTPLIGLQIAKYADQAGLPPGVLNVISGAGGTGATLIRQPEVRRVIFTGSVATGKKVAVACAERLCPVILELGGVGPALVRADADPELAARGVVWTRFMNCGQACVAAERVYVHEAIAAPFIAAVRRLTAELRVGPSETPIDVGPLINADAVQRVAAHVADAVAQGAHIETGGKPLPDLGAQFYAPTVLSGATAEMLIMREETFGPVLPITVVPDDVAAIKAANSLPLGLGATIWTKDVRAGKRLARQIETGMVWINDSLIYFIEPALPWGGVKESGIGRTHGPQGLAGLADAKVIAASPAIPRLWWFPYRPITTRLTAIMSAAIHQHGWRAKLRAVLLAATQ